MIYVSNKNVYKGETVHLTKEEMAGTAPPPHFPKKTWNLLFKRDTNAIFSCVSNIIVSDL